MTFVAERFSPFFTRSLNAWRQRRVDGFDLDARLGAAIEAPVDADRIRSWVEDLAGPAVQAGAGDDPVAAADRVGRGLRQTRILLLLTLIERDVSGRASLDEVCTAMTVFAECATSAALRAAGRELEARYGRPLDGEGRPQDLLAVGMGKAGGYELNVSSDLDLVFLFREEGETSGRLDEAGRPVASSQLASSDFMHRLARRAVNLLAETTADGFVFRVDTRLRPNGDSGPLVASLSMLEQYFYIQGREWERLAWLKGRVLGDSGFSAHCDEDIEHLQSIVTPFVFRRYLDFKAFAALRDLHAMITRQVNKRDARHEGSFDVKLGRGGIREIEFTAQLFQIVRGGRDYGLRDKRTLVTLESLGQRDLLSPDEITELADAYHLLRRTEHALQYIEDAQTHRLPAEPEKRAHVAAMLGLEPAFFEAELGRLSGAVERIFDALLNVPDSQGAADDAATATAADDQVAPRSPALPGPGASAPTPSDTAPGAAQVQTAGQGGDDGFNEAVERRIIALYEGSRFRAARPETQQAIEQLLAMPEVRCAGELGVLRLIDLIEAVAGRGGYIALLVQYPQARERVLRMLGRAKWAAEYLIQHPILLDELLDGQLLQPVDYTQWSAQLEQSLAASELNGQPDVETQMDILREGHHAQVFRLLAQDLEGRLPLVSLSDQLSELADRLLEVVIRLVWSQLRLKFREVPRFAAIAYGKLGGKELGYASDLDLVFLYEDDDERAPEAYALLGQRISNWLSTRTGAGLLFEIDLRLRPNGNAGLLVSSLASFERYQRESAWVWEHQALTRARYAAGDPALGARFEALRRDILAAPRALGSLREEVVKMRRKMLDGHPNRSRLFDIKHDRGGMVDIEFLVQFLVLAYGHELPPLLDNKGNIALLSRAADAGLIERQEADNLARAYTRYRQIQHLMRLNDHPFARLDGATLGAERDAVLAVWERLLGPVR